MKRRSQTSNIPQTKVPKQPQKPQSQSTHKKNPTKNPNPPPPPPPSPPSPPALIQKFSKPNPTKTKSKKNNSHQHNNNKDGEIQDYLMIDDDIYQIQTKTDREEILGYVDRIRREAVWDGKDGRNGKSYQRGKQRGKEDQKGKQRGNQMERMKEKKGEGRIEDIVKNLPVQQKMSLMRQLEKQLSNNPEMATQASINQSRSGQKQRQKQRQRDPQRQKPQPQPQKSPQPQQLQNDQKYNLLNLRLHTLQQQLSQKRSTQLQKINKLFYQGQLTASQRKYQINSIDKIKQRKIKIINCTRNLFYTLLHNKFEQEYFKGGNIQEVITGLDLEDEEELGGGLGMKGKSRDGRDGRDGRNRVGKNQGESSIQSQIQFEKMGGEAKSAEKGDRNDDRAETSDKKSTNQQSLLISPEKSAQKIDKQRQLVTNINFECSQQTVSITKKLQIPLLLTKQKIEQMQWQKKSKSLQKMRTEIDRKISFQMSELQLQLQPQPSQLQAQPNQASKIHFTTLADINGFIVALYQHIISKYFFILERDLEHVVSRLNMPFGKATRDKLFLLQQNGEIDDIEYYPVLDQSHLNGFNMETALTLRRFTDFQKIHNKAVFDNFNSHLNAYRPYYDLEGDVYPWFVSEKGLTFYEINQQNIEQVFEKTKIKVLQQCSTLCGIIPFGIDASEAPQILKQKNNENFQKEQKLSLVQNFPKWNIKIMDYDTMVRLLLTQEIFNKQIQDFMREIRKF